MQGRALTAVAAIFLTVGGASDNAVAGESRRWTPADSAALRALFDIGSNGGIYAPLGSEASALISPDGRHFMVLSGNRVLPSDQRVTDLSVYATTDAQQFLAGGVRPAPIAQAAFISPSGNSHGLIGDALYSAIRSASWCPDSACVQVIGLDDAGVLQVFHLDAQTGVLSQLTRAPEGIIDAVVRGRTVIYSTHADNFDALPRVPRYRYPIHRVARRPISSFPGDMGGIVIGPADTAFDRRRIFVATPSGQIELDREVDRLASTTARLSTDGRYGAWQAGARMDEVRIVRFEPSPEMLGLIAVQNLRGGVSGAGSTLWTGDGAQVVIVGARSAAGEPDLVVFDVASREVSILLNLQGAEEVQTEWDEANDRVAISFKGNPNRHRHVFERRGAVWVEVDGGVDLSPPARPGEFEVRIDQAIDRPQQLTLAQGGREAVLIEPDPALQGVRFNAPQRLTYRGPDGRELVAWLVLPPNFTPGSPIPIVIQNANPDLRESWFAPDGANSTGDAMQTLAARGIGVASVNAQDLGQRSITPADLMHPTFNGRFEALVDALVERGIADADRIGISGFSAFGRTSLSLMTHPGRTRIAAGAINDSYLETHAQVIRGGAFGNGGRGAMGGRRYWNDPAYWHSQEITANFDRLSAPVLFGQIVTDTDASTGFIMPPDVAELIGAANLNGVPLEGVLLTDDAVHGLVSPAQMRAYQTIVVDWFAFWLLGEEDPAPDKYAQYVSWRRMRDVWREQEALAPGPSPEEGFITTRAGMSYEIRHRVSGVAAGSGQMVTLNYTARDAAGRVLASSETSGPITVTLPASDAIAADYLGGHMGSPNNGLGRGWDQILRILHDGDRATLLMTPDLAVLPNGPRFEGPEQIRFEIEVTGISGEETVSVGDSAAELRRRAAVRDELRAAGVADPGTSANTLNAMGYQALYERGDFAAALRLFRWNLALFPQHASQLYDSLGEGYLQQGDLRHAIEAYDTAGRAGGEASAAIATRLRADPTALTALQAELRAAYQNGVAH